MVTIAQWTTVCEELGRRSTSTKTHLLPTTNQLETQIAADGATYQSWSLLGRGFAEPTGTKREETPGFPEYDAQKDGGNGQSRTRNL